MILGHFIVLEGIDGAGTSTQAAMLGTWFRDRGLPVHVTGQPTDGPIGSMIRQVLTHRLVVPGITGPRALGWASMALLFAADRLDHLDACIEPNLMDGVTVVCDRYDLSSIIYQSAIGSGTEVGADVGADDDTGVDIVADTDADVDAGGASIILDPQVVTWVRQLNARAKRPDMTIVLDVDPQVALRRRQMRSYTAELYEDNAFQTALAKAYRQARTYVEDARIVHIDGNADVQAVHRAIVRHVEALRQGV